MDQVYLKMSVFVLLQLFLSREVKIPRFRFTGTSIAILFTNFC
jgi:hypothetical protein